MENIKNWFKQELVETVDHIQEWIVSGTDYTTGVQYIASAYYLEDEFIESVEDTIQEIS